MPATAKRTTTTEHADSHADDHGVVTEFPQDIDPFAEERERLTALRRVLQSDRKRFEALEAEVQRAEQAMANAAADPQADVAAQQATLDATLRERDSLGRLVAAREAALRESEIALRLEEQRQLDERRARMRQRAEELLPRLRRAAMDALGRLDAATALVTETPLAIVDGLEGIRRRATASGDRSLLERRKKSADDMWDQIREHVGDGPEGAGQ